MGVVHASCFPGAETDQKVEGVETLPALLTRRRPSQEEVAIGGKMPGTVAPKDSPEASTRECSTDVTEADGPSTANVSEEEQEQDMHAANPVPQHSRREQMAEGALVTFMDGYEILRESGQRVAEGASKAANGASAFVEGFKDAISHSKTGANVTSKVQGGVDSLQQRREVRAVADGARDVFGALRAGVAKATKKDDCTEYTAVFDKSTGKKLGVAIDTETLCVSSEIGEGLVKDWNDQESSNPQVETGHRVVEVNGIRKRKALLAELQQNKILEVKLSRPKEPDYVEVVIEKPSKDTRLGVILTGDKVPSLRSVARNTIAHGRLQVGDQILSINGWNPTGHQETSERLKQLEGTIHIEVLRDA